MAGDWIKMRPTLLNSPKVNGIARYLEESPSVSQALSPLPYGKGMSDYVNRNVMRSVTVTSLLIIWGAANEHTSDGVFRSADLSDLDDMVGIPGFGEAMESVGWAKFDKEKCCVTLPNFNEYNTCGKNRGAESNRERQRRFREKKREESNAKSNVTGNGREEKNREEKNKRKNKQKEIPEDFRLHDGLVAYAAEKGVTDRRYLEDFTEEFIQACKAKPYHYADFDAAWKTWFRRKLKDKPAGQQRKQKMLGEE